MLSLCRDRTVYTHRLLMTGIAKTETSLSELPTPSAITSPTGNAHRVSGIDNEYNNF